MNLLPNNPSDTHPIQGPQTRVLITITYAAFYPEELHKWFEELKPLLEACPVLHFCPSQWKSHWSELGNPDSGVRWCVTIPVSYATTDQGVIDALKDGEASRDLQQHVAQSETGTFEWKEMVVSDEEWHGMWCFGHHGDSRPLD